MAGEQANMEAAKMKETKIFLIDLYPSNNLGFTLREILERMSEFKILCSNRISQKTAYLISAVASCPALSHIADLT